MKFNLCRRGSEKEGGARRRGERDAVIPFHNTAVNIYVHVVLISRIPKVSLSI